MAQLCIATPTRNILKSFKLQTVPFRAFGLKIYSLATNTELAHAVYEYIQWSWLPFSDPLTDTARLMLHRGASLIKQHPADFIACNYTQTVH